MSRSRVRVCLQDGLRLDLNRLARKGFIKLGTNIGARGIVWTNSYWGEVARGIIGIISADMTDPHGSWLEVQIGETTQRITLVSESRHFGGRQWFFVCPATVRCWLGEIGRQAEAFRIEIGWLTIGPALILLLFRSGAGWCYSGEALCLQHPPLRPVAVPRQDPTDQGQAVVSHVSVRREPNGNRQSAALGCL